MKNKILLYGILMSFWVPLYPAYSTQCSGYSCENGHAHINVGGCIPYSGSAMNNDDVSCVGWFHNDNNPGNYQYNAYSCKKCPTGSHLVTKYLTQEAGYNSGILKCDNAYMIAFQVCESDTGGSTETCSPDNCATTSWVNPTGGYEVRTCCDNGYKVTQYRCKAGYYGNPTSVGSGCSQCPTWSGVYTNSGKTTLARGTSSAGTTAITGCYVAPGTYYDATGTFKISSNCPYK